MSDYPEFDEPKLKGFTTESVTRLPKSLRDEAALAFLPHAITDAIRGYDHLCPTAIKRAWAIAYEAADYMLAARSNP